MIGKIKQMDEDEIKARYRNKLKKVIIEVWNGEKWLYVKTLSDPLKEFRKECLDKVSFYKEQNIVKEPGKFVQPLLNENLKEDTITEKELLKKGIEAKDIIMK